MTSEGLPGKTIIELGLQAYTVIASIREGDFLLLKLDGNPYTKYAGLAWVTGLSMEKNLRIDHYEILLEANVTFDGCRHLYLGEPTNPKDPVNTPGYIYCPDIAALAELLQLLDKEEYIVIAKHAAPHAPELEGKVSQR